MTDPQPNDHSNTTVTGDSQVSSNETPSNLATWPQACFAFVIWNFPFVWPGGFFLLLITATQLLNPFGLRPMPELAKAIFFYFPPMIFVFLLIRYSWVRKQLILMVIYWFAVYAFSGMTQGALSSALSKAFTP